MENFDLTNEEFDSLGAYEQYLWLVNYPNKEDIKLILDNDATILEFIGKDKAFYFGDFIGYDEGAIHLLRAIGIDAERC